MLLSSLCQFFFSFSFLVIFFYRLVKLLTEIKSWYSRTAQDSKTHMSVVLGALLYSSSAVVLINKMFPEHFILNFADFSNLLCIVSNDFLLYFYASSDKMLSYVMLASLDKNKHYL